MTLRQKTLAIILATMVGLLVLLYVGYSATVLRGFELLEQQDAGVNVERVLAYLASQTRNLSLQIKDWAHWDDTYQFIQGDYPTFPDDNLDNSTFDNLRLNLMAFVDNDRRIVFGKAYDIQTGEVTLLSENTQGYLDANPLLLSRPGRPTDGVAGLLVISETPVLVASSPILKSDLDGPPAGTLVWARYMTEPLIEQLSDFIQAPVVLQRLNLALQCADCGLDGEHVVDKRLAQFRQAIA